MNDKTRMKRIERAQMRVLFTVPFFAPGVVKLPVEFDDKVETACTNGERILFSPAFCDKLSDQELVTVLCHEVCHCMFGHLWRAPDPCNWDVWNQATDHAVNLMLKEFSAGVMAKGLADPFPFPQPESNYCIDPQFKGVAEEAIYTRLNVQKPPGGSGGGQGQAGSGKASPSGNPGTGQGQGKPFGQIEKPANPGQPGATQSTSKQLQNDWTATLLQSAKLAAGQGDLPGSLQRLVQDIVNPKIDWVQVLRSWLREQCADDWNWQAPALELEGSGFIMPSLKSEKMGPVVFGSDWSGSTFGELVTKFHAEKVNCLNDMRPSKLIDIGFDTRVVWEKEYTPGDVIDSHVAGGGGTSFVDVLRRCSELIPAPKCVVILTDLMGEFPKEAPPFPVVWVVYGGLDNAPFGQVINADE
jgi:predicted metal-dependent peptidase